MKLDRSDIPQHIKIKYIQKKYYNKYFYKLSLKVDESKLIKDTAKLWRSISFSQYTNRFALLNELIKKIEKSIVDDDYRFRTEGITVSLFTNSEINIEKIISDYPEFVIEFYKPLNKAHVDLIENHTKVLVRHSLFEKKYKFKVYMKTTWEQRERRFSEVKEWLENSCTDYEVNNMLHQCFYTDRSLRSMGFTAAVYFNDPQDLMMFQLRFHDKILKIEEAVLLAEL